MHLYQRLNQAGFSHSSVTLIYFMTSLMLLCSVLWVDINYIYLVLLLVILIGYIIDKNKRRIKKNNLILQLTEKEINFLILFSQNNQPLSRNFILKNVWNYSSKSETHTVETHIHRLRKKFLEKFKDSNFIKNNDKGYYI